MKIDEIIKKQVKKYKVLSKNQKFLYLMLLIFFAIFFIGIILLGLYTFGFMIKFLSLSFFNDIIKPLAFDLVTPWAYFLSFVFISIMFVLGYAEIKIRKKTPINVYFIAGIYIFAFLLIFGFSFISQSYGSEFTKGFIWNTYPSNETNEFINNPNCSISRLNCNSIGHYNKFVIDDELYCQFELNPKCPFELTSLDLDKKYFNNNTIIKEEINTINSSGTINFILDSDLRYLFLVPQFTKINSPTDISLFHMYIYTRDRYTLEEYHQKENEKAFLIVTVLSIALFSTIVAMNNLKQLLEKKNGNSN